MSRRILFEAPDFSAYQGAVNMKAVKDAGYRAVILRAGYGNNNVDQRFIPNAQSCKNLELPTGVYWFSYALNVDMAAREAQYAVAQAKKFWDRCPVAYDLEYDSRRYAATKGVRIDRELSTRMAVSFLKSVRDAGYIPVLYSNRDNLRNYFDMNRIRAAVPEVKLWYAAYADSLPAAELAEVDLWQYTSDGKVAGIAGRVDLNKVYTDIFRAETDGAPNADVNLYIRDFQIAANRDGYRDQDGRKLREDGIEGPKTRYVLGKIFLKAKKADGKYKVGSTGDLVRWLQGRLRDMGYELEADGKYGEKTRAAVIKFQKEQGLGADGIAGYNTLQRLFYA